MLSHYGSDIGIGIPIDTKDYRYSLFDFVKFSFERFTERVLFRMGPNTDFLNRSVKTLSP